MTDMQTGLIVFGVIVVVMGFNEYRKHLKYKRLSEEQFKSWGVEMRTLDSNSDRWRMLNRWSRDYLDKQNTDRELLLEILENQRMGER